MEGHAELQQFGSLTKSTPARCCSCSCSQRMSCCRCLDKAATRRGPKQPGAKSERWLYTVTQVEEVKRMLGFIPIMIATIIFNTVYAQMSTVFVEQVRGP